MGCPTCGCKMETVPSAECVAWCPTCGTQTDGSGVKTEHVADYVPALVTKCREFAAHYLPCQEFLSGWERLGIHDAITPPEDRKETL